MNYQRLTPRQIKRMYALLADGMNKAEIARALDVKYSTVHHRIRHDSMTEEQRAAKRGHFNRWRKARISNRTVAEPALYRPTPEMIRDRDVRAMLPHRDLTAAMFGDPKIGMSALEGRR
jgi:IS30 family transposase